MICDRIRHLSGSVFYDTMHSMNKLIVLMGGQGVGKGTFAKMLASRHKYQIIETGQMLRDAAKTDTTIAEIMARGELLPFETLTRLIARTLDIHHDTILDGFPRTMSQAQWLIQNYADKFDIHVLYLDVPQEIMIQRIKKRIRDGGGRADDADMTAVMRRLDIFWNETMPAIRWLESVPGIRFSDVDVRGDVNDNFNNILTALSSQE